MKPIKLIGQRDIWNEGVKAGFAMGLFAGLALAALCILATYIIL